MKSAERRITVLASIYPRLKEWADRDGLTVADVANAILLQNIQPYGAMVSAAMTSPALHTPGLAGRADPYQAASLDAW